MRDAAEGIPAWEPDAGEVAEGFIDEVAAADSAAVGTADGDASAEANSDGLSAIIVDEEPVALAPGDKEALPAAVTLKEALGDRAAVVESVMPCVSAVVDVEEGKALTDVVVVVDGVAFWEAVTVADTDELPDKVDSDAGVAITEEDEVMAGELLAVKVVVVDGVAL